MAQGKNNDCFSCKVISIGGLLGIGGYIIVKGKSQVPVSKYTMYLLGIGVIGLGVGEMFNKSPFRDLQK